MPLEMPVPILPHKEYRALIKPGKLRNVYLAETTKNKLFRNLQKL